MRRDHHEPPRRVGKARSRALQALICSCIRLLRFQSMYTSSGGSIDLLHEGIPHSLLFSLSACFRSCDVCPLLATALISIHMGLLLFVRSRESTVVLSDILLRSSCTPDTRSSTNCIGRCVCIRMPSMQMRSRADWVLPKEPSRNYSSWKVSGRRISETWSSSAPSIHA